MSHGRAGGNRPEDLRRNARGEIALWGLEPGSESGWASLSGPQPLGLAVDTYQYLVFNDPKWDYHTLDPAKDVAAADKAVGAIMNSADPNLKPFFSHGGKLIHVSRLGRSRNSAHVQRRVLQERRGEGWRREEGGDSIRLFMVPGMGHCAGGDGPNTFNSMAALSQWVEQGKAPEQIVASHSTRGAGGPHPSSVPVSADRVYKGSGSTDDAANFSCKVPLP